MSDAVQKFRETLAAGTAPPAHPAADALPWLPDEEAAALAKDVAANGITVPILIDDKGRLIDGRNRVRALLANGDKVAIDAAPITVVDPKGTGALVASLNIYRRHLEPVQRLALVDKLLSATGKRKATKADAAAKSRGEATPDAVTTAERAKLAGVSPKTVKRLDRVAKADPKAAKKLASSGGSIAAAEAKAKAKTKAQQPEPAKAEPLGPRQVVPSEAATAFTQEVEKQSGIILKLLHAARKNPELRIEDADELATQVELAAKVIGVALKNLEAATRKAEEKEPPTFIQRYYQLQAKAAELGVGDVVLAP